MAKIAHQKKPQFSQQELAEILERQACNDCGVNVIEAGEYYMVKPEIWEEKLKLGWHDNLCIGCLEAGLGHRLSLRDFICFPDYDWLRALAYDYSGRLADRYGLEQAKNGKWRRKRI
jgi:hypothetical protein